MTRRLCLRVSKDQYNAFAEEADKAGYELASLMRKRIFGKVKNLRIMRRPCYNTRLLGDTIGHLIGVTGALHQNGSHLSRIAERLSQSKRDLFGLDGALHRFDQLGQELHKTLNVIEAIIKGRPTRNAPRHPTSRPGNR